MPGKMKPKETKASKTVGLSADEKAAMKERMAELKATAAGANDLKAVLAKIATLKEPDRAMAKRLHALITATAPHLQPRTWYGMPAYAKDDKVVCFFQSGIGYKTRYCTLGFQDKAALDDGPMWPTAYALKSLDAATETRIAALVKKAAN